ncbi:MAG: Cap15 family cyclic dinucleotide receptor domain-containing protein [Armatimonadota bacterium]
MKDEKRLFVLNSVVYLLTAMVMYAISTSSSGAITAGNRVLLDARILLQSFLAAVGPAFLCISIINTYVWRLRLFRKLVGIKTPCIIGRWEGYIKSTYTNHEIEHKAVVEIWQTLNRIYVWYYDQNAITNSLVADLTLDAEGGPMKIYCVYRNQPIRTDDKNLQVHHGVMELFVDDDSKKIHGIYYNNPFQRSTYGEMHLEFCGRKLCKTFESQPLDRKQHSRIPSCEDERSC